MSVRLELLGGARLVTPNGSVRLERRTAAVLAYLALEGEAVKYRLGGWLWPDSPETTARNNMRQLLRRARNLSNVEIISGEDRIQLLETVTADATEMHASAFAGNHTNVLEFNGELLDGLEFDDCPDFEEWLVNAREGISWLRRNASASEAERLEQRGEFTDALRFALEHVRLEPISEEAHRRVMRLRYLMGDRAAAMSAFEQLKSTLERELGVQPLPESLELLRQIERGAITPDTEAPVRSVPLSVLRPPVLVGREREWAQLEAAFAAGQTIFISGEPGAGKSRLAQDFAAIKGAVFRFSGRPGDAGVPFSSQARGIHDTLVTQPELLGQLPDWVRAELSRLLPELNAGEPLPPLATEAEKLRLYNAFGMFVRQARRDGTVTVSDDVQFVDRASSEMMMYLWGNTVQPGQLGGVSRVINIYRRGELASDLETMISDLVTAGLAVHIELEPLGAEAVNAMLKSLDLPETADLGPALTRYTGGNPLFMLETVKHLWETGQLRHGWPGRLPPPGKVGPLVRRRLERLSEPARRLAWAVAVLGTDNSLERAAKTLDTNPFDLAEAWAELERAQVLRGAAFSHDLIFEATLAAIPGVIRGLLHRQAALTLETDGGNPARVAEHWLEGGEQFWAAPWLVKAAELAHAAYRLKEAADFYAQAADLFETNGDLDAAFEAHFGALRQRLQVDASENTRISSERLLKLARTPRQRAQASLMRTLFLSTQGRFTEIEPIAQAGLEDAVIAGDVQLEADLLEALATIPLTLGKPEEAVPLIERMVSIYRTLGDAPGLITATIGLGMARRHNDRPKALEYFHEAHQVAVQAKLINDQASALNSIARSSGEMGLVDQALEGFERARDLLRDTGGAVDTQLVTLSGLARNRKLKGNYIGALEATREAFALGEGRDFAWLGMIHLGRAQILLSLDDLGGARQDLETAMGWPGFPVYNRLVLELVRAELEPNFDIAQIRDDIEKSRDGILICQYHLIEAQRLKPALALESLERGLEAATEQQLGGMQIALLVRQTQTFLVLEQPDAARKSITRALELSELYTPTIELPELWLTHYHVLEAKHDQNAHEPLETALAWLDDTAHHRVPDEHRQGFLERNPVNRAVMSQRNAL